MLDHVCAIPHRSSRVTSFRRFAGAMSGGRRWPGILALAFRQRRLHPVGGALRCPQLAHHRKELNPSVMPLVVLVCGGGQCRDCRTKSSSTSRYESISEAPRTAR